MGENEYMFPKLSGTEITCNSSSSYTLIRNVLSGFQLLSLSYGIFSFFIVFRISVWPNGKCLSVQNVKNRGNAVLDTYTVIFKELF